MKLLISAVTKTILGVVLIGALLFWPAGTFNYPGAWLFIGLLFIPTLILGVVLFILAPDLLKKRIDSKEKEAKQGALIKLMGLMFLLGFIISALDFRYGWSSVPAWLVIASSVAFLIGYLGYAEVLRENAYLSRTVEVQDGQTVVSTGLYGVVRHPMYLATLFMFLPLPLILDSLWGLIPMVSYIPLIIARILNEEKVLCEGLKGYPEYTQKVKYRLIPFVW